MAASPGDALLEVARSGHIGRPVFVRWTATYEGPASAAPASIDEGLSVAAALFGVALLSLGLRAVWAVVA